VAHLSFSALKKWNDCPFSYKLTYVDGIRLFAGNKYTAFGTAIHNVCEQKLLNESVHEVEYFESCFKEEIGKLPPEEKEKVDDGEYQSFLTQGRTLAPLAIPALRDHFGPFEIVSTEEQLYEPIDDSDYLFKGFIDLVIKTEDGIYHIIDWKSCSWGWNHRKKTDPMITYQLTLYKKYFAKKHSIELSEIETHFGLLKRTAKKDQVEIFQVSSGERKLVNASSLLSRAIKNIDSNNFIKNKLSCARCEFYNTVECPRI
jgi:hypothetical protein